MKRFNVNVISKEVIEAAKVAERLLSPGSLMLEEIRLKNDFKYNSGTGEEVYQKIVNCDAIVPVFTYRPKWRFTKAIGYFGRDAVHINIYKLDELEHNELVGLLVHEWLHKAGFGHGNNYKTKEKVLFSVNYFASENVSRWVIFLN